MIFLTNEHVQQVLDMKTCLEAMEDAYRELNEQRAGYRPRIDFYVPHEPTIIAGAPWRAHRANSASLPSA